MSPFVSIREKSSSKPAIPGNVACHRGDSRGIPLSPPTATTLLFPLLHSSSLSVNPEESASSSSFEEEKCMCLLLSLQLNYTVDRECGGTCDDGQMELFAQDSLITNRYLLTHSLLVQVLTKVCFMHFIYCNILFFLNTFLKILFLRLQWQ